MEGDKADKREAPHGKAVPQAAEKATADAPEQVAQAPAEAPRTEGKEEPVPSDPQPAASPKAPAEKNAPTAGATSAAPAPKAEPKAEGTAPETQPAVAARATVAAQARPAATETKAPQDDAVAKKEPAEAPAPQTADALTPRTAATVQPVATPAKPADPQPTGQEGQGAEEGSEPKDAAPEKVELPEKTEPTQPTAAHATPAQAAPRAPAPVPLPRAQLAPQPHAGTLQPGADAVAVQAWRHYDTQAGGGYRQQVQALAGRTAGQMSAEIVRQAQMVRQNGSTTIRMQLNPPEMGRIRLEVRMKSDHFEVRMQVENPDVRQAMTRELAGLDRTLRDAQVDVQRFDVTDYQSGRQGAEQGGSRDGAPTGGGGPQLASAGEQDTTAAGWARISTSGAVDCLI